MIVSLITMLVAHLTNGMQLHHGEIVNSCRFVRQYCLTNLLYTWIKQTQSLCWGCLLGIHKNASVVIMYIYFDIVYQETFGINASLFGMTAVEIACYIWCWSLYMQTKVGWSCVDVKWSNTGFSSLSAIVYFCSDGRGLRVCKNK